MDLKLDDALKLAKKRLKEASVELVAYSRLNLRAVIDKIPEAHKNLLEDLLVPSPSSATKT